MLTYLYELHACVCVCAWNTSELLVSVPRPLLHAMSRVLVCDLYPRGELAKPRGELLHLLNDHHKRPKH